MQQISQEYFTVITLMIMLNASIATPILRYIYDPSKRYINYKRRTIQHSRHETELKTLVCIHEEDDVFGLMNILKACYPTKKTPIVTYALDLMELVGRMTPIFINHQYHKHQSLTATTNRTDRIISAFQQFETQYEGIKRVNFTAVAPYNSMHDEICTLALDKGVSLLVISFQKSETIPRRGVKRNVLEKSPCSVGILVNKRIVISRNVHTLGYNICLAFLGGPDSREALALAMRMLENQLVSGLVDWTYEPELGIIGDILASTDTKCTAPVLVIQQQSTVEDLEIRTKLKCSFTASEC